MIVEIKKRSKNDVCAYDLDKINGVDFIYSRFLENGSFITVTPVRKGLGVFVKLSQDLCIEPYGGDMVLISKGGSKCLSSTQDQVTSQKKRRSSRKRSTSTTRKKKSQER